jgi:hypothetical protein
MVSKDLSLNVFYSSGEHIDIILPCPTNHHFPAFLAHSFYYNHWNSCVFQISPLYDTYLNTTFEDAGHFLPVFLNRNCIITLLKISKKYYYIRNQKNATFLMLHLILSPVILISLNPSFFTCNTQIKCNLYTSQVNCMRKQCTIINTVLKVTFYYV